MKLNSLILNTPVLYKKMHGVSIHRASSSVLGKFVGSYIHNNNNIKIWKTGSRGFSYISQFGFSNIELGKNSDVIVHCSCPYFTYFLEAVMYYNKASFLYNATPEWPEIRNPSGMLYLCKHLFKMVPNTLEVIKQEVLTRSTKNVLYNPNIPKFNF